MKTFPHHVIKIMLALGMALIIAPNLCLADGETGYMLGFMKTTLEDSEIKIKYWEKQWSLAITLTLCVVVFGAVSATIQGLEKHWTKMATIICGVLVTIITGIMNTVGWDHRQLKEWIDSGKDKIQDMRMYEALYHSSHDQEAQNKLFNKFIESAKELTALSGKSAALAAKTKTASLSSSLIATAMAEIKLPEWVKNPPSDEQNLYYTGVGDSTDVDTAAQLAKDNALQNAKASMAELLESKRGRLAIDEISDQLAKAYDLVKKEIIYDKEKNIYRCYSLIRIDKSVGQLYLNLLGAQKKTAVPQELVTALSEAERSRNDYSDRQLKHYEKILNATRNTLSTELFEKFDHARSLRKDKKEYDEAIILLKEIVNAQPDFYFGWFNLALSYAKTGEVESARQAYEKALALEPGQTVRDATIYNSYGHFLYESISSEYCMALSLIKKSLELDPSNPRAKNNLQQVSEKVQSANLACR